ncbi:DUF1150 family protein [Brevirhabdus sp.]|uniref:DUF1150 family protein n=1 Tax=Brevirhabdus sp. TaxID=2004514 RepID=UPI004059B059
MNEPYEFAEPADKPLVYVRSVDVHELPEEVQAEAKGLDHLYAVHTSDGARLALVRDRKLAFVLARQNDFSPVAVH